MLEIIPVLDLKGGIAVSGQSGLRDTYTPLQSIYGPANNLIELANSLRLNGAKEMYIADLDLIEKVGHNVDLVKQVNTILPVVFDCGITDFESFEFFLNYAYKVIVATETLKSIDDLRRIFEVFPKERISFSIDVKDNKLYSKYLDMDLMDFKEILRELEPNEIIILDISSVGTGRGFNEELFKEFEEFKDKLILAGGIDKESIEDIAALGVKKALIGTSIHNGDIPVRPFL